MEDEELAQVEKLHHHPDIDISKQNKEEDDVPSKRLFSVYCSSVLYHKHPCNTAADVGFSLCSSAAVQKKKKERRKRKTLKARAPYTVKPSWKN